ncbi:hypothetical protein HNP99_001248 [Flavobacterium sp. 28A]|uniref:hypothetical protein n=1 Tax=Flavobacterium sp. 28A TaxID=2735895 RepID=UPI0015706582|nr:hypothetical protein [Flavobacterium sp. 28A]NRT14904.1 hypothetical protein [Flavobacterium sp. 28A]
MVRFTTIQKKVNLPYRLKYYFASSSDEFGKIDFEKKLETFRSVVSNGYSIYDLSEHFRKNHADQYSHEDMKNVLCSYISWIIYNDPIQPVVTRYYRDDNYETVAQELDKLVINPIDGDEFMIRVKERFGIA